MKQLGLGLKLSTKKTSKREFLEDMERVVPWAVLVQIVEPHYAKAKTGDLHIPSPLGENRRRSSGSSGAEFPRSAFSGTPGERTAKRALGETS